MSDDAPPAAPAPPRPPSPPVPPGPAPEGTPPSTGPPWAPRQQWPPPPSPAGVRPPVMAGHVVLGLLVSLALAVVGTFVLLFAGQVDGLLGLDPYSSGSAADFVAGFGILTAVALFVAAHFVLAQAARRRWGMPGMAIGLAIAGSIGFLYLSMCGFLYFSFRGY